MIRRSADAPKVPSTCSRLKRILVQVRIGMGSATGSVARAQHALDRQAQTTSSISAPKEVGAGHKPNAKAPQEPNRRCGALGYVHGRLAMVQLIASSRQPFFSLRTRHIWTACRYSMPAAAVFSVGTPHDDMVSSV